MKWSFIGKGSNLLVADSGFAGAVLLFGEGLSDIRLLDDSEASEIKIRVGGGCSLARLLSWCTGNGYSGLELDNCLRAQVEDCNMHDCRAGSNNDGYGYIAVDSTTVIYRNCGGSGNYYDFYEVCLTGSAIYENCIGTKVVYDR